jgi:hypothetical protein
MSQAIVPEELAERVRALIDRHDGGEVLRAARRMGVRASDLRAIVDATAAEPSLSALAGIVRVYDVDAWWLIAGTTGLIADMPAERRVEALNLLSQLAAVMTMQRRLWHDDAGTISHGYRSGAGT